ncbi:RHS repeat-associated core domain-containing protein [Subtercola boreus]|nr:RHS repeat-associated core domain-containing protein [Subtercola boreus]
MDEGDGPSTGDLEGSVWAPGDTADDGLPAATPVSPAAPWEPLEGGRFGEPLIGGTDEAPAEDAANQPAIYDNEPTESAVNPAADATDPTQAPAVAGRSMAARGAPVPPERNITSPGLGSLPYFQFQDFSLSDHTVARVNLGNGNLVVTANDESLSGPGIQLRADRFYNGLSLNEGSFGGGWSSSMITNDVGLYINPDTLSATFTGPSGFTAFFKKENGAYTPPPGFNAALTKDATTGADLGIYTITYNKSGEKLRFTPTGYLISDKDRNNQGVTYVYDTAGHIVSATQDSGRSLTVDYTNDANQYVGRMTDSAGRVTTFIRDANRRLQTVTAADGTQTTYTYDNSDRLTSITVPGSPNNTTTSFDYDSTNRVTKVNQQSTSPTWGARADVVTDFDYSFSPTRTTNVTDADDNVAVYNLDNQGRVTSTVDGRGDTRAQDWNANSDIQTTTSAFASGTAGGQTTIAYDSLGNATSVAMPTGAGTAAQYARGTTDCPGAATGTAFQVQCSSDASGSKKAFDYDTNGNPTKTTDVTGGGTGTVTQQYTYSAVGAAGTCAPFNGLICTATNGNGAVTTYSYDSHGNLTQIAQPAPLGAVTNSYDALGRVTQTIDGNGYTTIYSYDVDDRLLKTQFNNGDQTFNAYYPSGAKQYVWDKTIHKISYEYDTLGHTTKQNTYNDSGQPVDVVTYKYTDNGNLTEYTDSQGLVKYGYDAANNTTSITEPGGTCTTGTTAPAAGSGCIKLDYYPGGVEKSRTFPGGAKQVTAIDRSSRTTDITATPAGSSTPVVQIKYDYTAVPGSTAPADDRTTVQHQTAVKQEGITANAVTSYAYDSRNHLTAATEMEGATQSAKWSYQYDNAGNRTKYTRSGTSGASTSTANVTYNAANEITATSQDTTNWGYDAAGNQTQSGTTGVTSSYNNRGAVMRIGGQNIASYGAGNTTTLQRGNNTFLTTEFGVATQTVGTNATVAYTRTSDGNAASRRTSAGSTYYVTDRLGSVVGLFDTAGVYKGGYSYTPYGEARRTATTAEATSNALRYIGGLWDPTANLYKLGARYYDPNLGRFTQADPSGQEANPYAYAGCNPINGKDSTGLISEACGVAIAGEIFSIVGIEAALFVGGAASIASGGALTPLAAIGLGAGFGGL